MFRAQNEILEAAYEALDAPRAFPVLEEAQIQAILSRVTPEQTEKLLDYFAYEVTFAFRTERMDYYVATKFGENLSGGAVPQDIANETAWKELCESESAEELTYAFQDLGIK